MTPHVDLAAHAAEEPVEDFARRCRELARRVQADEGVAEFETQRKSCRMRRRVDRDTGMYHFHLEVDPVTGSTGVDRVSRASRLGACPAPRRRHHP
ncbi:MAG: hypothetical protein WKF58_17660 [Ilumatobacteraceae bacterium]